MASNKTTNILYWVFNGLFGGLMLFSAIPDIIMNADAVTFMHDKLFYPTYLLPFIGVAKALGVIAIFIPGFPRIKEWAYAGLMIDIIGATYSVICVSKSAAEWAVMPVFIIMGFTAYYFYHKKNKPKVIY